VVAKEEMRDGRRLSLSRFFVMASAGEAMVTSLQRDSNAQVVCLVGQATQ
jgi:hypothetical protein